MKQLKHTLHHSVNEIKTKASPFCVYFHSWHSFLRQVILFDQGHVSCSGLRDISFAFSAAFPQFTGSPFSGLLLALPLSRSPDQTVVVLTLNQIQL